MMHVDMTARQPVARPRRDSAILTSWLLLSLPLLWAAVAIYQLPFLLVGWATYVIVAAMCAELIVRIIAYVRTRLRLRRLPPATFR